MEKEIKKEVGEFIISTFMSGKGPLNDGESLFENNIIDSFGMLELIAFVEKKFGISINPSEAAIENFDSVNKITQLIKRKLK